MVSGPKRLGRPDPASYQRCESTFWASVSSSDPCPFQRGLSMQSICDSVCGWQVPLGRSQEGRSGRLSLSLAARAWELGMRPGYSSCFRLTGLIELLPCWGRNDGPHSGDTVSPLNKSLSHFTCRRVEPEIASPGSGGKAGTPGLKLSLGLPDGHRVVSSALLRRGVGVATEKASLCA